MDYTAWIILISFAGPIVGSAIGVSRQPSFPYICNMLCFAAGVMLAISFLQLIPESIHLSSSMICVFGVVTGAFLMFGLDRLIPHIHPRLCSQEQGCNLERTAVYLIIGMFFHNFPEGMAIAAGGLVDMEVSMVIALAIAIHGIPEGVCTSAPFFHVTGERLKAFLVSSSTAIPIVAGYLIARYVFGTISPLWIGFIIGTTAGLMIYITVDELIPNACVGTSHLTIFSLLAGIVLVMLLGSL
jgi:ZIP family zinc transporter